MEHNDIDYSLSTSETIEHALGTRLNEIRLERNMRQSVLAKKSGVSRGTIARLGVEGAGISLNSFIRIMQGLGLGDNIGKLLPITTISPIAQLEAEEAARANKRKRASGADSHSSEWTWNEDQLS